MQISVLHPNPVPPASAKQLIYEARKRGHKAIYVRPQEVRVTYDGATRLFHNRKELKPDVAFIRGTSAPSSVEHFIWTTNIVKILEEAGAFTVNSYSSIVLSRDKSLLPSILVKNGIKVPRTLITENLQIALDFINEVKKVVLKPIIGSLGRGVILLEDVDVAYTILKQLLSWNQPLLLQEYIEKKENRDIRILVINGEIYAAYYRKAKPGFFKTNLAQGAIPEPASLDEELKEMALKIAEILNIFYVGIDVAESVTGERYVLEANASPNWKGPLYMGLNPAEKLIVEVEKELKR